MKRDLPHLYIVTSLASNPPQYDFVTPEGRSGGRSFVRVYAVNAAWDHFDGVKSSDFRDCMECGDEMDSHLNFCTSCVMRYVDDI